MRTLKKLASVREVMETVAVDVTFHEEINKVLFKLNFNGVISFHTWWFLNLQPHFS